MNQEQDQPVEEIVNVPELDAPAGEQFAKLLEDVRELVKAEVGYVRSRIDYSRHVLKWSWRYGAVAAFAFSGAAISLVIGLVLTLSPIIGPLAATLIVSLSFTAIGIIFALIARKWIKRIYFPELGGDDHGIP
jgi:Putative Actinobacterial Holin-X, holin superfamily III